VSDEFIYRTSRSCGAGNCVEAAPLPDGAVALRDSKNRNTPPYILTSEEWKAFITEIKNGDYDFFDRR
jgi:hypothetical protein